MPITADDIRDGQKLREAMGQYESGEHGGSCFGVTDPSRLRPPFSSTPAPSAHPINPEYNRALAFRDDIAECFRTLIASEGADVVEEKRILDSVPPGLYEHFKSAEGAPKFYVVHGVGFDVDTARQPRVSYAALYNPHAGKLAFRHLFDETEGFLSPIRRDVYTGARFHLIAPLTRIEIDILLQYLGELTVKTSLFEFRMHVSRLLKKKISLV